jgi:type I restriction enzyme R subunit
VFAGKDNGLIVDYVGVFRNLEAALATYATGRTGEIDTPIRDKDELVSNLEATLAEAAEFLAGYDIDLGELEQASGFEFVALQASAAEALLIDDDTRRGFMQIATAARNAFKALLPDPVAQACTSRVAAIRSIAKKLASGTDPPDIGEVMDSVSELLDRSVGAKEYLIRALGDPQQLVDLSKIDFEQLALQFAKNKRTVANRVQQELQKRLQQAVEQNPTRIDLAEKFQALIDDYNAGTHNIDEILRRLKELSAQLSDEEQRSVREGLNEAELAIFDLLTKPDPELTPAERDQVRKAARQLLEAVTDRLVLDWQRHSQTRSAVQVTIAQTLDSELPDPYDEDLFNRKVDAIFAHICNSYGDDGTSPYNTLEPAPIIPPSTPRTLSDLDSVSEIDEEFLDRCKQDPVLFAELMHHLLGANTRGLMPRPDDELLRQMDQDEVRLNRCVALT